jgi:molybdopterin-guanine dinucleotide biosynthesis protein A
MMRTTVMESLVRFTHEGQRKIDRWTALHATRLVEFADANAFANANTADELRQLQRHD